MMVIAASLSVTRGETLRALVVAVLLGWPSALGLLALLPRVSMAARRWLLLAAVGTVVIAVPTLFSGIGWWFGAIEIAYGWAWWSLREVG